MRRDTRRERTICRARAIYGVAMISLLGIAPTLSAQRADTLRRPAKWSAEIDVGGRLPGSLYDQVVLIDDPLAAQTNGLGPAASFRTRWDERTRYGIEGRGTLRYRPENGVGIFVSGVWGRSDTEVSYSGGRTPPESVLRSVSYQGFEAGLSLRLAQWANHAGLLEYFIAPTVLKHTIDTSPGHRDAFALVGEGVPLFIDADDDMGPRWTSRTYTAWGLSIGSSIRVPLGEGVSGRVTLRDLIVPVNTAALAQQERADIRLNTGETVGVRFSPFTAHHVSLSVGVEYTFQWGKRPRAVLRRLPFREQRTEVTPAVVEALDLLLDGDTVRAEAMLREQVEQMPEDALAWRELALLRARRAEFDGSIRDEVLSLLEHALNMNAGDEELLFAFGRIRGLVTREGRTPEAASVRLLRLSDLAVYVGREGGFRLAFAIDGLTPDEDGVVHYRAEIEVFDADGRAVGVGAGAGELRRGEDGSLVSEGSATELPLDRMANLFLFEPTRGIYTARLTIVDLETGIRRSTSTGFEIESL